MEGRLLPALIVATRNNAHAYIKATVDLEDSSIQSSGGKLALKLGSLAGGELIFGATDYGLNFTHFHIDWISEPLPIVGLYFGTALLSDAERRAAPILDQSFWPNWDSAGFCVPGAKGAPLQSVFRRWDLGGANLPLGSFGPALGTPPTRLHIHARSSRQHWGIRMAGYAWARAACRMAHCRWLSNRLRLVSRCFIVKIYGERLSRNAESGKLH